MAVVVDLLVVAVVAVFLPTTLSGLPPALHSPVEEPRICEQDGEYCFSYDRDSLVDPNVWFRICGSFYCFFGANQSPININPQQVERGCSLNNRLHYKNEGSIKGLLENDGYYAKFTNLSSERKLFGVPGYVDTEFMLDSIHVHIGKKGDRRQTEHHITRKRYDAEVHMVHSRGNASGTVAGQAVVAIFLSTREGEDNAEMNKLLDKVENIKVYEGVVCKDFFNDCDHHIRKRLTKHRDREEQNEKEKNENREGRRRNTRAANKSPPILSPLLSRCEFERLKGIDYLNLLQRRYGRISGATLGERADKLDLAYCARKDEECPHWGRGANTCGGLDVHISPEKLLPQARNYYYYYGSLTTPTLSESVLWHVMMKPIKVSQRQLERLYSLKIRIPGALLSKFGNLRPLQKLNGRKVHANVCG